MTAEVYVLYYTGLITYLQLGYQAEGYIYLVDVA